MTTSRFSDLLEQNATDIERVSSQIAADQLATAAALRQLLDEQGAQSWATRSAPGRHTSPSR
jgi:hypothetical protein